MLVSFNLLCTAKKLQWYYQSGFDTYVGQIAVHILSLSHVLTNSKFLFCLSQRVLLLLRGAPSEVHLLICRPGPGALNDGDNNSLVS